MCALHTGKHDGQITCWDYNQSLKSTYGYDNINISLGYEHVCLLKENRNIECSIEDLGIFRTVIPQDIINSNSIVAVTNSN